MNKKAKTSVIASSVLAIALSASIGVGATYALFTSESTTNIAVTSGKVSVKAEMSDLTLYSPTEIASDGSIKDDTNAATTTFANGGTATLSGNELTLTNVTPGDKATFKITVKNESTVSVKYRTAFAATEGAGLFYFLETKTADTLADLETAAVMSATTTAWENLAVGAADETMYVSVELPATEGDLAQGLSCKIAFTVEAVQGNASTTNDNYTLPEGVTAESFGENFAYMNGEYYANLTAALKAAAADETYGATVYLKPNAVSDGEENGFNLVENLTIYGNGATMDSDFAGHGFRVEQYVDFTQDVTLNVYDLDDITVWGNKTTEYTFTLNAENCSFSRIYINGTAGKCNLTVKNGTFDVVKGYGNDNTTIYCNADGFITVENSLFRGTCVGLNINHKATGNQDITVKNCTFLDCAVTDAAQDAATNAYYAPIRIYEKNSGATGKVVITGCAFAYSAGKSPLNGYDILLNKIHKGTEEAKGTITYTVQEGANMYAHPDTTSVAA